MISPDQKEERSSKLVSEYGLHVGLRMGQALDAETPDHFLTSMIRFDRAIEQKIAARNPYMVDKMIRARVILMSELMKETLPRLFNVARTLNPVEHR